MSRIKRILVTGATGYIGSMLVKDLEERGHNVSIITRQNSNIERVRNTTKDIRIFSYDGSIESILKIFRDAASDIVIHLASLFAAEYKEQEISSLVSSNILFGNYLLEGAKRNKTKFFINTGTHRQHYKGDIYNPACLYAATKQAFETIARYYLETSEMRMLTIKLIDTYGPFDPRPKVMSLLKRIYASGEELDMSPGYQELGLLYIDDVIKAFVRGISIVSQMGKGEERSMFAAPGEICNLREIAGVFEKVMGRKLNINWGKRPYREREMMRIWKSEPNILKAEETIPLFEGIKKMLTIEKFLERDHV